MITLGIAILFVGVLQLCLTGLLVYGVSKMRSDLEFWQNLTRALLGRYWRDRPRDGRPTSPLYKGLADWLEENPDRPHKDDPPFVGGQR